MCQQAYIMTNNKSFRLLGGIMETVRILLIICGCLGGVLLITLGILFFISRKSQRVMESVLQIMLHPEQTQIKNATRVLATILGDEIAKIESSFQVMRDTLAAQIKSANELKDELTVQNDKLIALADDATKKIATMSQRLDNTVTGLGEVVASESWTDVESATDKFSATITDLVAKIDATTTDTTEKTNKLQSQIDGWITSSQDMSDRLQAGFDTNTQQMRTLTDDTVNMQNKLTELTNTTADGFEKVKTSSSEYESIMAQNNKLLDEQLVKLDSFSKQSKKQLTTQMNSLTNTANVVGGQVRLAESSIEKQIRKLTDAVEALMSSATQTESAVRGISTELAALTNKFDGEIKEFATGAVTELKTVSGVANKTLENTKTAAGAFSESVRTMATSVRETLIEMNTAHQQLSGQSANLIKMSNDTTAQLQPLSELIEKYYAALPDLSRGSTEANDNLTKIVANMNDKINAMKSTVAESTDAIAQSAIKLEDLAGQSRQQMIDLMSDYSKAVGTMQTLNKQLMIARATAPMDAIKDAPVSAPAGTISSRDFLTHSQKTFDKLHEQSLDLTRATGADIPDVVWKKYHDGDKTIFSKWLAKMLGAADKKRVREILKSDSVFRSQATQFVRSFDKILGGATSCDSPEKLIATLKKTDLGVIYSILKTNV